MIEKPAFFFVVNTKEMFHVCINSIKNTFIFSTDTHYYKITEMLKQF